MSPRTVHSLLQEAVSKWGDAPALHQPVPGGKQKVYTWREFHDAAVEVACGLHKLGLRKGDVVALDSETRAEFYLADFAIMAAGCIAAAVYTAYPASEIAVTLGASTAKLVFVDTPKVLKGLLAAGGTALNVQWVLLTGSGDGAMTLEELRTLGRAALREDSRYFERLHAAVKPADYAILYLTSGATGEPKMGLTTHGALVSNVDMGPSVVDLSPKDSVLVFLPSAHIAQRIGVQLLCVRTGVPAWFSEGLTKLPHELQSVRPTYFLAPPRVWERIYSSVCTEIKKRSPAMQRLFWGALGLSLKAAKLRAKGAGVPAWMTASLKLADKVVFTKLRQRFGGRMSFPVSGAAPLGKDLAHFYEAIGMPIREGYGLTEGGITTLNPPRPKPGSIGRMLPGVQYKFTPEGELCLGGPTIFSGYFQDPETTAQVLRDGWLHTGDIAELDADGFFSITGRKKELIVSSNGKKIYPSRIENLLKMEPIFNQMILVGDKRPYISALFTINQQAAESLAGKGRPVHELVTSDEVKSEVKRAVGKVNKLLAPFEQVRKFRILERDFTIENGELTATMKVRRAKVLENFQNVVSELYVGKEEAD